MSLARAWPRIAVAASFSFLGLHAESGETEHLTGHLGDEQVTSGLLVNLNGRRAGSFGLTCTLVAVYTGLDLERCDGWGTLPGGQLTFAGMSRSDRKHQTWAITGGTGSNQTARGEIQLDDINTHETAVTATLIDIQP